MDGVGFTGGQLVVLAAAFGPLLSAIGVLFHALLAAKNEQCRAVAAALELALKNNDKLASGLTEATRELRELRQDLWRKRGIGQEGSA